MIPDDLRHLERPGFQLFTPDEAGGLLAVIIAGLILYDLAKQAIALVFG